MHLKLDQSSTIDDGDVARDLGQDSADIVVLSAADSDLATFAKAHASLPPGFPSVQVTNILALGHPASVDLYVERTLANAQIVLLRMLGGEAYWPYGVESLRSDAIARGSRFVAIPGEMQWDAALAARGTATAEQTRALWDYCREGGVDNAALALQYAAHLIDKGVKPSAARPMPAAGFWPHEPVSDERPVAAVVFYRALALSGDTAGIDALAEAVTRQELRPVCIYVTSLKDERSLVFLHGALAAHPPDVVINATAFASATVEGVGGAFAAFDCPVLQVAQAGTSSAHWRGSARGLNPRDLAMHVVLPEVDGRIFANAIAFKERITTHREATTTVFQPVAELVDATAALAANWVQLRWTSATRRRVAIILANYPSKDGRLANGVGLDTPESLIGVLQAMRSSGYSIDGAPEQNAGMMALLQGGPTNAIAKRATRVDGVSWPLTEYVVALSQLPADVQQQIHDRWGPPANDPHVVDGMFRLALHCFGNVVVGVQPSRGYNIDPLATYHDPDLVPPHYYLAFYLWLRRAFDVHAVVHLGKHGNLEWLPGKSTGLSQQCFPTAILGPLPHLYPFIVNDPGEGIQAKRRASAVIVDHLTPPLTRAELHDDLARLEALVDEYAVAADLDPRRAGLITEDILSLARAQQLDVDVGVTRDMSRDQALRAIDAHLCDLKEMQIRDGLHVFGCSPDEQRSNDLLVSIARVPRSTLAAKDASLHRALAQDLGLDDFDPLARDYADVWNGPRPLVLNAISADQWRTAGDTIERIEALALALVAGTMTPDPAWRHTVLVLDWIAQRLRPAIAACGHAEMRALLQALDGKFIAPGPSGAPTRGRPDVLPTGRNFFAVDGRAVPTPSAWRIGQVGAQQLVEAYWQQAGEWPRSIALSAWGTANMRTGGDDVAQALALIGARPVWDEISGRVTGFAVVPLSELKRPRIDVTFRVSGLFRDAFPMQMDLLASAISAIAALDEPDNSNPIAANVRNRAASLMETGMDETRARRQAASRVFGSMPGAYGAGLQALIDEEAWRTRGDIADAYLAWGGFAYGGGQEGDHARDEFAHRLSAVDLVVQAQDNREHDILDSDDYYQFMGGLAATVQTLRGSAPRIMHVDTSRPEMPIARALSHEISRVVRGRAANPKWIAGVMRHGYKGAFEIAATVDYLFGFAASTDAVGNHHFDQLFAAYIEDEAVRAFMCEANPSALTETIARFAEARRRGLWSSRSNSADHLIAELTSTVYTTTSEADHDRQ